MNDDLEILRSSAIFDGIPPSEIPALLQSVGARMQSWNKGELIRSAGDEMDFFGIVLSGEVQAALPQGGRDQIVGRFPAGDSFAEAAPVALKRTPVTISAVSDVQVVCVNPEKIAASTHPFAPNMYSNLMAEMSKKLIHLSNKLSILGEPRLRRRILIYLDSLDKAPDGSVSVNMKYKELADYLGVNKAALSRELGRMQDEGIIRMDKKSITVLKTEAVVDAESNDEHDEED